MGPATTAGPIPRDVETNVTIVAECRTYQMTSLAVGGVAERYNLDARLLDGVRPLVVEIGELDNGGEPCTLCQLEGHVVELQVYGTDIVDGENVERECCRGCMATAVRDLDDITIELVRG